jgi:four helix bundle protein
MKNFKELRIWQNALNMYEAILPYAKKAKAEGFYKLCNQVEGASGSILDNIAEGMHRGGNPEFIQFLYISKGSCAELESQLYRLNKAKIIPDEELQTHTQKTEQLRAEIQALINYIRKSNYAGEKKFNQNRTPEL